MSIVSHRPPEGPITLDDVSLATVKRFLPGDEGTLSVNSVSRVLQCLFKLHTGF